MAERIPKPAFAAVTLGAGFALVLGITIAAGRLVEVASRRGGSTSFDRSVTTWIVLHRDDALTALARSLSTLGSQRVLLPVVAVVAIALLARHRFGLAAILALGWSGALALYSLAKDAVGRPRPPPGLRLVEASGNAFPSGHAVQSLATLAALAFVGGCLLPRSRWVVRAAALVLAVGVGWSRIYLGVHWSSDVIAGWAAAGAWTVMVLHVGARTLGPVTGQARPSAPLGPGDRSTGSRSSTR